MTSENYENVIKLLKDQFSSLYAQVSAFVEQLFKLKRVKTIYNVHILRRLYDEM